MRLRISTRALDDHESRMYCSDESTETVKVHIDQPESTYTIIKRTKLVTTIDISERAIKEFLDDADYYAEFKDEMGDEGYMFERAAASVRKQLAKQ